MQEKLTIARPYASAAFSHAKDSGQVAEWSEMLSALADTVSHPEMQPLIGHPKVSKAELADLMRSVMGNLLDDKRGNFVELLIDAERIQFAPEVAELFERQKTAAEGVVDVEVIAAYPVSESEQQKIANAIRKRVGQDCEVRCDVDESLIGGAVIRVGDSVIDISLKGRLQALAQRMA